MKPYWIPYKLVNVAGKLFEKFQCNQCNQKCQIIVAVDKEPPTECISEYENSDMVGS